MFNEIIKSAGAACVVSKTNLIIGKMKKLFNYNDNSKKYKNRFFISLAYKLSGRCVYSVYSGSN